MKRALAFTLMVLAIMIIAVSCEEPQAPHEHTYAEEWSHDDTFHWHASACGHEEEVSDKEAHKWKGGDEDGWIVDVASTETEQGKKHRECSVCGYNEEGKVPLQGHVHTFSAYDHTADKHWRICTGCGEKFTYTHTFSYVDAKELGHTPTCYCGYKKSNEAHSYNDGKQKVSGTTVYDICDLCDRLNEVKKATTNTEVATAANTTKVNTEDYTTKSVTIKNDEGEEVTRTLTINDKPVSIPVTSSAVSSLVSDNEQDENVKKTATTTVTFPEGALKVEEGASNVSLIVAAAPAAVASSAEYQDAASDTSVIDSTKTAVAAFEFKLEGAVASDLSAKDSNNKKVGTKITTYIAKNLCDDITGNTEEKDKGLEIKYLGSDADNEKAVINSYEKSSGKLEFTVYHFSKYAIISSTAVATDDKGTVYSVSGESEKESAVLESALKKLGTSDITTITLMKDIELTSGITLSESGTLNLNGKTITSTKVTDTILTNNRKLTLRNGTLDLSVASGNGYTFIANRGTLSTDKVEINMKYKATGTDTNSSVYGIFSGNGSGESTLGLLDKTIISLDVVSESSPIKPTAVYCIQNTKSTIEGSEITTTSSVNGSVYGFYVLVYDQDSDETEATGTLTGTTISVSTSGIGSVTPVFAESWDDEKEASITLTGCTVKSISNCANNSSKTVYGVRAKGSAVVTLDASTENDIHLYPKNSQNPTVKFAAERQDHKHDDKNLYGTIITPSYITVSKNQTELESAISKIGENGTIVLVKDLELTNALTIGSGKAFTLDLCDKYRTIKTGYSIANSGNLTIKNGKIGSTITPTSGAVAFSNNHGAVLTTSGLTLDITFTNDTNATGDLVGLYNVGEAVIENSTISVIADGGKSKVLGVYSNDGDAAGTTVRGSEIAVKSSSEGSSYGFYMLLRSYPESDVEVKNNVTSTLDKSTVTVTQSTVGSVTPVFAESYEKDYTSTINITGCTEISGTNTVESNKSGGNQKYVYAVRAKGNGVINIDSTSAAATVCKVTSTDTAGAKNILEKETLKITDSDVTGTIKDNYTAK